jgi:hypothetical protein
MATAREFVTPSMRLFARETSFVPKHCNALCRPSSHSLAHPHPLVAFAAGVALPTMVPRITRAQPLHVTRAAPAARATPHCVPVGAHVRLHVNVAPLRLEVVLLHVQHLRVQKLIEARSGGGTRLLYSCTLTDGSQWEEIRWTMLAWRCIHEWHTSIHK